MKKHWISIRSIPSDGATIVASDQSVWEELFTEYQLSVRIVSPIEAQVNILPQEDGVLLQGTLKGVVAVPCSRCTEESHFSLNEKFSSLELFPKDTGNAKKDQESEDDFYEDIDEEVIRFALTGNGLEINPIAYIWEELSLSLPIKAICGKNCKGICPVCGKNKNKENCDCLQDEGDPRLAQLRNFTIKK